MSLHGWVDDWLAGCLSAWLDNLVAGCVVGWAVMYVFLRAGRVYLAGWGSRKKEGSLAGWVILRFVYQWRAR